MSIQISDRVQEVRQRGDSDDIEIKSRGADYLNRNMDSWFVGFFSPGDSNLTLSRKSTVSIA